MNDDTKYNLNLLLQFIIVLASVLGSLIFSEVMNFAPCDLCWYQRLCIYPMALIILTGLYLKSRDTVYFLTPFSFIGLGISIYHNLVYYKVIEVIVPCSENAPCTQQHINWLGFITIPLLSFFSFSILVMLN
ncbi:MAG: disulfide bond formation protein B, partial [Pseudobdellovibrionaceae bacterium]